MRIELTPRCSRALRISQAYAFSALSVNGPEISILQMTSVGVSSRTMGRSISCGKVATRATADCTSVRALAMLLP